MNDTHSFANPEFLHVLGSHRHSGRSEADHGSGIVHITIWGSKRDVTTWVSVPRRAHRSVTAPGSVSSGTKGVQGAAPSRWPASGRPQPGRGGCAGCSPSIGRDS